MWDLKLQLWKINGGVAASVLALSNIPVGLNYNSNLLIIQINIKTSAKIPVYTYYYLFFFLFNSVTLLFL